VSPAHPGGDGDSARAETELPLPPDELFGFVRDVERLLRLNPQLAIARWTPAEWGFRVTAHNESNDRAVDVGVLVDIDAATRIINFRYDAGLKQGTRLSVEPAPLGARLVVVEDYPRIEDPADPRVAEVDKSLVPWVAAIRRHLLARRRWGRLPGWRWWNESFMLRMAPRSRRIVRLLLWISLLEFLVFLGAVAVLRLAS
jgi:hypothetical protein